MYLSFRDVRQSEASECGLVCLALASGLLGAVVDLAELRRKHPVSLRGLTLKEIAEIASAMGLATRGIRCDLDEVAKISCPAILHWDLNHFVVLERVTRKGALILDPAEGPRTVSTTELSRRFTGVALEVSTAPAFERRRERSPLRLSSLFRWSPHMAGTLAQALLLSLLLQAYVLASPFYLQLAIDEAALKGDRGLLVTLAVGFGMFAAFNAAAEVLRGIALQRVSSLITWDMTRRLFHHLVRLPLAWFQRRRLADALTRFDSLAPVRNLIANGLVAAVIDGALSLTTFVMMIVFAPTLALVTLGGLVLYVAVRLALAPYAMRLGMAALSASIEEQGKRIETLRVMQTIKMMTAESRRENDWANKFADTVRATQATAFLSIGVTAYQRLLDASTLIITVFLGVASSLDGKITIGILYAFLSYRAQFLARALGLFEQVLNWQLLDLHTYRLADIALHPLEDGIDRIGGGTREVAGKIELMNVSFAYAPHEAPVLRNVTLTVEPGEFLAIVGPSGGGKSTLLKVLCGLYTPSGGEVRIDGASLASWGPKAIRTSLAAVMQDDELVAGSIAENVAFFDERIDAEKVWACLAAAAIDDEIKAMPMRAETFVGDLGSSLSGGQKQRILLARALYREPRILILDEATSSVDLPRERSINDALKALSITRVLVAHRPETIASADRVMFLAGGLLVPGRPERQTHNPSA